MEGGRKGQREKEQKQTRDTCGERRSGFRLKPHKKNNFAVGEEIREREKREGGCLQKDFFFGQKCAVGKISPTL